MTKTLKLFSLSTILLCAIDHGHCQTLAKDPAFEVASITPCPPGTGMPQWEHDAEPRFVAPGGRFTARATTVKFLIEWAYGIQPAQHTGGPAWLGTDRYDIVAKGESDATEDQMKLMARKLLAERFHLRVHQERNTLPVLVLSIGKGSPKLFPSKEGETHSIMVTPQTGPDKAASFHVVATRYTLAQFTDTFARHLDHVIVDKTGLDGEYDFTIDLTPDESGNPLDAAHLLEALRQQLGLSVKAERTPVDVLVIEGADKAAAGN